MWSMTCSRRLRVYESNVEGRTVGSIAWSHSVRNSPSVCWEGSTYSPRSNFDSRSTRARSASRLVRKPECHFWRRWPVPGSGVELDLDVPATTFLHDRAAHGQSSSSGSGSETCSPSRWAWERR